MVSTIEKLVETIFVSNESPIDYRVPMEAGAIQVNTCTNSFCINFGIAPVNFNRAVKTKREKDNSYIVVGANKKRNNVLTKNRGIKCKACGRIGVIHSNQACLEEKNRFLNSRSQQHSCRNKQCGNHASSIQENPSLYSKFGRSQHGSLRYRCKACKKTFSIPSGISHRLRKPEKTLEILRLLINKVPMRRICEIADISPSLLYQRVDLIYDAFSKYSDHDKSLFSKYDSKLLHLCSDRQDITLNWDTSLNRRTTVLKSIATAEMKSGFILAQHLNFDPSVNPIELELEAREVGDPNLIAAYRRHARVWMPSDFRPEADNDEESKTSKVFVNGAMIREIYTQYGHFLYLETILRSVSELQFSIDPDSGMGRAVLASFKQRVLDRTLQACLVKIQKDLTVSKKKLLLSEADNFWESAQKSHPDIKDVELLEMVIRQQLENKDYQARAVSQRWIEHPLPSMNEPYRKVQLITHDDEGKSDKALWAIARASLRSIDRYFMSVRRRLSLFERPIHSSSSANRAWHGYQAYNPYTAVKMLEIFRVVYNYHLAGTSKLTPAQKLGVLDKALTLEGLLDGDVINNSRKSNF